MKFRTDFVTNSSSNSYCVSLIVEPKEGSDIMLDLLPNEASPADGCFDLSLKWSNEHFVESVKQCKTTEELSKLLVEAVLSKNALQDLFPDTIRDLNCFSTSFIQDFKDRLSHYVAENDEEYAEPAAEVLKKIKCFEDRLSRMTDLAEIKSVIVHETFCGWGEFEGDAIQNYLERVLPLNIDDWDNIDAVREALHGTMEETRISTIVDYLEEYEWDGPFDEDIYTEICFPARKVQRRYSRSGQSFEIVGPADHERHKNIEVQDTRESTAATKKEDQALTYYYAALSELNKKDLADREKAFHLLKMAADGSCTRAYGLLGTCFVNGAGTRPNYREGMEYLSKAAQNGDENARRNLQTFSSPDGVYKAALAIIMFNKKNGAVDSPDVLELLFNAAERGSSEANNLLGVLYLCGERAASDFGVNLDKNRESARKYFEKAIELGSAAAKANLKNLDEKERAESMGDLSERQMQFKIALPKAQQEKS